MGCCCCKDDEPEWAKEAQRQINMQQKEKKQEAEAKARAEEEAAIPPILKVRVKDYPPEEHDRLVSRCVQCRQMLVGGLHMWAGGVRGQRDYRPEVMADIAEFGHLTENDMVEAMWRKRGQHDGSFKAEEIARAKNAYFYPGMGPRKTAFSKHML